MSPASGTVDRATKRAGEVERQLLVRVDELLARARDVLAVELPVPGGARGPLWGAGSILGQVTWAALAQLEQLDERNGEQAQEVTALALDAGELEGDVRRHTLGLRAHRLTEVQGALGRLRRFRTSADLLDAVCHEAVSSCGFSRAMLSRIAGEKWQPWMVHFDGDPDSGREFIEWIRGRDIRLDELMLERELVAENRPEIVLRAAENPRSYKPLVVAGQITSYVVAPIVSAGRVVGLLHADHGTSGRDVDLADRDVLWAFAEGFARLYERVVLLERIRAQHRSVRETFEVAESTMTSLADADIELVACTDGDTGAPDLSELIPDMHVGSAEFDELLTAKEKEVLAMIIRGLSNAAIAERLVIKVGTVKSHVKHILRKLGAVNRAAAISKYLAVTHEEY